MIISVLISIKPTADLRYPIGRLWWDGARWITGSCRILHRYSRHCVEGHISTLQKGGQIYARNILIKQSPRHKALSVSRPQRGSIKFIPMGLMHVLWPKGWEVSIEPQAGGGYLDIRLVSRKKGGAVLMSSNPAKSCRHIERDANKALEQIIDKNYRTKKVFQHLSFYETMALLAITCPRM